MTTKIIKFAAAIFLVFQMAGCAQTMQFRPDPVATNFQFTGLPADAVKVEILDLRPQGENLDGLPEVIKLQIGPALSKSPSINRSGTYILRMDIIEHRAFFTLGNWNASTRLRANLLDFKGNTVGKWDSIGNAHRSNMWGYATAQAVSQDAYNIAIADMMSTLSSIKLPSN